MRAVVVTVRDPFHPTLHREVREVRRRARLSTLAPATRQPHICLVNGRPLLRAGWRRRLKDGDVVAWVVLPQGGGGDSNPVAAVLMIAVAIFAPQLAFAVYGALGGTMAAGAFAASAIGVAMTAAVTMAGSMLINALIPPPKPPGAQTAAALAAPSPTYSLTGQGNAARIGQPIPVLYGRHLVYPDFAAQPYTEYAGNEQYLYQLMVIGQGRYSIEAIRIEDTPVGNFEEIEYQVVAPGDTLTLFPANVVTATEVSGQDADYNTALGPFTAAEAGTLTDALAFDVILPRGLYYANDNGGLDERTVSFRMEAREIDDAGAPLGDWTVLANKTLTAATTTPIRRSYRYGVAPGRYECRFTRTSAKSTDSRTGDDLAWGALRAYLRGSQDYGDLTLIAFRMRATNNLSAQAARRINLIVQRLIPTWDPVSGWSDPVATRNPAWAFADAARAAYGAGLDDVRLNLAGLYDLAQTWDARGDRFDGVFDTQGTIWEALTTIARAGRAFPFLQGGVLHCFRDGPAALPVAMFSPRNMQRGSFKLTYKMPSEEMADAVDVEYFDETTWAWRKVRAALPGSAASQPVQVKIVGVTSRQQAWQEGMYMAACNRYRRRFTMHGTEMDGFIPSLGDLVSISHDMPRWGQVSDAIAFDPATRLLTVAGDLDFSAGGTHYLAFRLRDGRPAGPFVATATADPRVVTLSDWDIAADPPPDTGLGRERAHVAFGPAGTQWITARVLSLRPQGVASCTVECVVESDYVHTADTGAAPGASAWQLPADTTAPRVLGLTARSLPSDISKMILSWQPAPGADHYLIEQSNDGQNWIRTGETSANSYSYLALYGAATLVRVAAVGLTRGPWIQVAYGEIAGYMWTSDTAPMWSADTNPMWSN